MKKLALSALLFAGCLSVFAGTTPSLTGKWTVHNSIAGTESEQLCTLTQKDKELTGTCQTEQGQADVTGKVTDKGITWQYKSEWNGNPLTLVYTGTVDASPKISGSVEVQPMGVTGEFTASPAK